MSTSETPTNGTPPQGHDWGERTKQGYCIGQGVSDLDRAPGYWKSDAYELRQKFGISPFEYDPDESYQVYPDVVIHETQPETTDSSRATNALVEGKKGSGKTTLALDWAYQQLAVNGERVLWRGDQRRSGWLPFRHWTTLWLPASVEHEAAWMLEEEDGDGADKVLEPVDDLEADADVRAVRYYDDPVDLCEQLAQTPKGTFNVIYPDPAFTGCIGYTRQSEVFDQVVEFRPKWAAAPEESPSPTTHWWFIFLVARIEHGPFVYTSLFFDELADFAPENASNEGAQTATLIEALRSVLGESRRRFLSIFGFCQEEADLHHKARRRFDWRVAMPGRPNPCQANNDSRVGFRRIPMEYDTMRGRDPGVGLVYNESYFNWFPWSDVTDPALEHDEGGRWLTVTPQPPTNAGVDAADAVEFDDRLFGLERRGNKTYLVPNDPGDGYLTVETGVVGAELTSPIRGSDLEVYHLDGGGWEVVLTDGTESSTVARLDGVPDGRAAADRSEVAG